MRKCTICKKEKPPSGFYIQHNRGGTLTAWCKDCKRLKYRKQRENFPEAFKRKEAKYYKKNKKRILKVRQNWYKNNKEKVLAHRAVVQAVYKGVLIKTPCEKCGEKQVQAHHEDYEQPLKVNWLCRRCHMRLHPAHHLTGSLPE